MERRINTINRNCVICYEYYTGQKWGNRIYYDLYINTAQTNIKQMTNAVTRLFVQK